VQYPLTESNCHLLCVKQPLFH